MAYFDIPFKHEETIHKLKGPVQTYSGNAENLKTETMNVLTGTEQLTSVTVDAEALIQQAAAIKANAEDLASRVRNPCICFVAFQQQRHITLFHSLCCSNFPLSNQC